MQSVQIHQFPAIPQAPADNDVLAIEVNGITYKVSKAVLAAAIAANISPADIGAYSKTQTYAKTETYSKTETDNAIAQSTANTAQKVTQSLSIRLVAAGYNTGSGNYFDFFLPMNVDTSKTYAITLSGIAIQYSNKKLESYIGSCRVLFKQVNGLYCEIAFTQTQTSNIPGVLVATAAFSVS